MSEQYSGDPTGLRDRDLLERIYEAIYGNGQPGMLNRLTVVETKVDERTSKVSSLAGGGVAGALITILIAWLREKGLPV